MRYYLTINRFNTDDSEMPETIVSRQVDADYVVDLLLAIPNAVEEEPEELDEEPETDITSSGPFDFKLPETFGQMADETPEPTKPARKASYDREAIEQDILAGDKTKDIAARHGISQPTVSKIKRELKASGEVIDKPKADDVEWHYTDVLDMMRDGFTDEEIYQKVYNRITHAQYLAALEWGKTQI